MAPRPLPPLLAVLLALSGCVDGADGQGTPERYVPPAPEPAPPEFLPLWNGTLAAAAPGGSGEQAFTVPSSGYVELFLNTVGPVRAVGDLRVVLVAPDGTETVYAQGPFVQDDEAGVAVPEASRSDWRARVPVQGGTWSLRWSVDGDLRLPLMVEAL